MTEDNTENPNQEHQQTTQSQEKEPPTNRDRHFDEIFIKAAEKIIPVLLGRGEANLDYLSDGAFCAQKKKPKPSAQVYCIDGKWGSGKSSLKNYIEQGFQKLPKPEQPFIIDYSAWEWQEQGADLRLSFFDELGKQLKGQVDRLELESNKNCKALTYRIDQMALKLDAYKNKLHPDANTSLFATVKDSAELITFLIAIAAFFSGVQKIKKWDELSLIFQFFFILIALYVIYSILKFIWHFNNNRKRKKYANFSLNELKKAIQEDITELTKTSNDTHQKIIVFLDDLDRLNQQQIAGVMQLVKANSDFEHMVFVLLMDKAHVENQLNKLYDTENFLEKMVQQTVEVPVYNNEKYADLLKDLLEKSGDINDFKYFTNIIKPAHIKNYDDDAYIKLACKNICDIFVTFRSLKRFTREYLQQVKNFSHNGVCNLNLLDLLIVTAIKQVISTISNEMKQVILDEMKHFKAIDLTESMISDIKKNEYIIIRKLPEKADKIKPFLHQLLGLFCIKKLNGFDQLPMYYENPNKNFFEIITSYRHPKSFFDLYLKPSKDSYALQINQSEIYDKINGVKQGEIDYFLKDETVNVGSKILILQHEINTWCSLGDIVRTNPKIKHPLLESISIPKEQLQKELLERINVVLAYQKIYSIYLIKIIGAIEENSVSFGRAADIESINNERERINNFKSIQIEPHLIYQLQNHHPKVINQFYKKECDKSFADDLQNLIDFEQFKSLVWKKDQQTQENFCNAFNQLHISKAWRIKSQAGKENSSHRYRVDFFIDNRSISILAGHHKSHVKNIIDSVNKILPNAHVVNFNSWQDFFNIPQEYQLPILHFLWYLTKYAKENGWVNENQTPSETLIPTLL